MTKKRWTLLLSIAILLLISIVYYKQTHLSIWGFSLPKKDIKEVIVLAEKDSFIITDKDAVLTIAKSVSKMKKHSKIETFPPESKSVRDKKIMIRTEGNITYGSNIWVTENNAVLESNGYYWDFDYNAFMTTLNTALENAALLD